MSTRTTIPRRSREIGWLLLLFAVSLAFRLPAAIWSPTAWFYDADELTFLGSLLGLIGGETPNALQWPAAPVFFAFLPLVLLHFLLTSPEAWQAIAAIDPYGLSAALALYLGEAFYDPLVLLVPFRIVLAVVGSLTAPLAFGLLPDRFDRTARLIAGLVLAGAPTLVRQTAIVKGDSLALLFWTLALALLMTRDKDRRLAPATHRAVAASALQLGLATASRLTHLVALPLLPLYAWWRGPRREPLRLVMIAVAAFAIPLFVFLPFFWTQPFTFLKAVLGNVLLLSSSGSGSQSVAALSGMLTRLAGPVAILLAIPGLAILATDKGRRDLAGLTAAAFLLFLAPLARSGHLPPHYTLPLLPMVALWAGVGASALAGWATSRRARSGSALVAILAGLLLLVNGLDAFRWVRSMHQPVGKVMAADWLAANTREDQRLALPLRLSSYVPPDGRSLEEILTRYRERPESGSDRLARLLGNMGRSNDGQHEPAFLLDAWLGDDEAIDVFRYRSMRHAARSGATPPTARDVLYYQLDGREPDKPNRVHRDHALELLRSGEVDLLLIDSLLKPAAARGLCGDEAVAGWWVYHRPEDEAGPTAGHGEETS